MTDGLTTVLICVAWEFQKLCQIDVMWVIVVIIPTFVCTYLFLIWHM